MRLAMVLLAAEPAVSPDASLAAVQVALIGALAPVILVVLNEIFKRYRGRTSGVPENRDGVLAPVEEIPRAQFEQLLERVADMDERAHEKDKAHSEEKRRWQDERRDLASEVERQRREIISEVERRVRAETMLQAIQGGAAR